MQPIATSMSASLQRSPKSSEMYCEPWSERWIKPGPGRQRATAILEATRDYSAEGGGQVGLGPEDVVVRQPTLFEANPA